MIPLLGNDDSRHLVGIDSDQIVTDFGDLDAIAAIPFDEFEKFSQLRNAGSVKTESHRERSVLGELEGVVRLEMHTLRDIPAVCRQTSCR